MSGSTLNMPPLFSSQFTLHSGHQLEGIIIPICTEYGYPQRQAPWGPMTRSSECRQWFDSGCMYSPELPSQLAFPNCWKLPMVSTFPHVHDMMAPPRMRTSHIQKSAMWNSASQLQDSPWPYKSTSLVTTITIARLRMGGAFSLPNKNREMRDLCCGRICVHHQRESLIALDLFK